MKKFISNKYFLIFLGIILFFIFWLIISLIINNQSIFPNPFFTIKELIFLMGDSYIYKCLGYSFLRLIIGFSIGSILGIILGLFVSNFKNLNHVFNPTITALKALPTAALIFLFIVLVGYENAPIILVSLICFPILYEATLGGVSNIPNEYKDEIKALGPNSLTILFKIKLPLASSYIFVGLLSSFALSFKVEIMSEIISGNTSYGLGVAIKTATQIDPGNMVPVFAYSLIAILFILLISIPSDILKKKFKVVY